MARHGLLKSGELIHQKSLMKLSSRLFKSDASFASPMTKMPCPARHVHERGAWTSSRLDQVMHLPGLLPFKVTMEPWSRLNCVQDFVNKELPAHPPEITRNLQLLIKWAASVASLTSKSIHHIHHGLILHNFRVRAGQNELGSFNCAY